MSKKMSSEEESWERDAVEDSEYCSQRNCLLLRLADDDVDDDYQYMETVEWIKYY